MSETVQHRIGVMTSGGDAPGMNAALRAVVRAGLMMGAEVYAIWEGYKGLVMGGDAIRKVGWEAVGGIISRGGTIIGTARCQEFRTREGRLQAAQNLLEKHIDRLVIIGGDGSLTGANLFSEEWADLVNQLVVEQRVDPATAARHPHLAIVGLVGSIDNDMYGTDMTIGTDTALHRITEAIDAINSTASSHQRTFVVEVMGRNCGYLALMSALATGADWVLIPESPPDVDNWEDAMCRTLKAGRRAGRRHSTVIVAEGACDYHGTPIPASYVRKVLEERLGEDTRVTILGHVQRGGAPSAFDRNMSSLCGTAAVEELLRATPDSEPYIIGLHDNQVVRTPLMYAVEQTHAVAEAVNQRDFARAMALRGSRLQTAFRTLRTTVRALPHNPEPGQPRRTIAVLHCGALAPGMNTAARVAVRLGLDKGHTMLGVRNGFAGLINDDMEPLYWMDVADWTGRGGAELGTNERVPRRSDYYAMARTIEQRKIDGILMIGGNIGYQIVHTIYDERTNFPAFNIPIVCVPASINNDLVGCDLSIGADTALNNIVRSVDKVKQSAVASSSCYIVEVMGGNVGYLAVMSGLATGAERVYTPEEGVHLRGLLEDIETMVREFKEGKRVGLIIRNENAHSLYDIRFMQALFEEEGGEVFDVQHVILGHLQRGGDPSPFDRIQATRFASDGLNFLLKDIGNEQPTAGYLVHQQGKNTVNSMEDWHRAMDIAHMRPRKQWWLSVLPVARILAGAQIVATDEQHTLG